MKNELLNQYKMLVNFLGKTLGPSFEIVLHEIKGEEVKMIAIANGEISNRTKFVLLVCLLKKIKKLLGCCV